MFYKSRFVIRVDKDGNYYISHSDDHKIITKNNKFITTYFIKTFEQIYEDKQIFSHLNKRDTLKKNIAIMNKHEQMNTTLFIRFTLDLYAP